MRLGMSTGSRTRLTVICVGGRIQSMYVRNDRKYTNEAGYQGDGEIQTTSTNEYPEKESPSINGQYRLFTQFKVSIISRLCIFVKRFQQCLVILEQGSHVPIDGTETKYLLISQAGYDGGLEPQPNLSIIRK